jgi:hypothetical protein
MKITYIDTNGMTDKEITQTLSVIQLAIGALPKQETRKPTLTARANDQVGIGQPSHVEVTSDRGWSHRLGGFGERLALNRSFPQQRANGVGDLVVATVPSREAVGAGLPLLAIGYGVYWLVKRP